MSQDLIASNFPIEKPINVEGLVNQFLSEQQVTENSKTTYKAELKEFFKFLQESSPDRSTIIKFADHLKAKRLSPLTINNYLTVLKIFFQMDSREKNLPGHFEGREEPGKA